RFVLHVNLGLDKIFVWTFDGSTGKLTPNNPASVSLPPGDGPRHFAFHPNGNWLYSLQEEGPTIVLFDYDSAKGTLAARQTISSLPPGYAGSSFSSEILVSSDGRFVYAGNRLHDGIAIFSIGEKGELTYVDDEWTRGNYPRNFNFDPTGNFLYSCNQRADNLATFRVDKETGKLAFTGQYTPVGNPSVIVFLDLDDAVSEDGRWTLEEVKGGEGIALPQLGRNITAAFFASDPARKPLTVEFNEDATKVTLQVPESASGNVTLEVADNTTQFPDGRIVLSALDGRVEGDRAKLETHPGNHRIGFWSNADDSVHWSYQATRPGMYDVELTYSVANGDGNQVELSFGSETLTGKLVDTGSWYRYTTVPVGRVYIEKAGEVPVKVRGVKMKGAALMNLKAITLRPAPEGKEIKQAEDGSVELDAHDATVHGVTMQYERQPQKMCLGYWVNPNDWASWTFPIEKPGTFRVELTQGCGAGHGGSEVSLLVGGKSIGFIVEDTGGFQNWKARDIGEVTLEKAGEYRLEVRPKNQAKVAVMDIRRVRLVPVQ
ncbi:MAG: beta-propeller fold lactonase family protein, partial [Verrucomicrobia bacterium]|nr:beta-propeller fold lactonase family protein [Verrucomicrobiota bacterium]